MGIVPDDLCYGIVTPIPKFKGNKKNVSADDFRGITVNPISSKIFEHCLLTFLDDVTTCNRQFGFKKGVGCLTSIHTVRKIVNYFNARGNTVNLGLIDLRRAFDKTSVYGVLQKLQKKNINAHVLKVLEALMCHSCVSVKWNGALSQKVSLTSGVRQGGILSPLFFAFYVDGVLDILQKSGVGCYIGRQCYNSYMYADDLIVISISVIDLQKLFNICHEAFRNIDLSINATKSHCIRIGPRFSLPCKEISINSQNILWEKESKFLGVTIVSGKIFSCNWHDSKSKFYKASNSILSKLGPSPSIDISLALVKSQCVPAFMYGMSAVSISKCDINKLTFVYNSIFCKLFKSNELLTVRYCQYFCNFLPFANLVDYNRYCFLNKLYRNGYLCSDRVLDNFDYLEMKALRDKYHLQLSDSSKCIK